MVVDGETGLLVPAGDPAAFAAALATVAAPPGPRRALGAAGRARVERLFSVERMARDYQALREVLEARSCARAAWLSPAAARLASLAT